MILPVVSRNSIGHVSFLICLRTSIDESTFLRKAEVKQGTYAGELLAKLHDAIFNRSLDMSRDYVEYYAIEYATFGEYAHKRFLLRPDVVRKITKQFGQKYRILHFHPGYSFLEDDYGLKFLTKLLEPRRSK